MSVKDLKKNLQIRERTKLVILNESIKTIEEALTRLESPIPQRLIYEPFLVAHPTRLRETPGLPLHQHSSKKFFPDINRIIRKQEYFKKVKKKKKMTQGKPQAKNPLTRLGTACPHSNGTLIVRLQIQHAIVGKVFIDNGPEVNILFGGATIKIGIMGEVNSRRSTIQTLRGTLLNTLGTICLMFQAKPSKYMITFHVMDNPSP